MRENDIQREIVKYLEEQDTLVIRLNAGKGRNNQRLCPPGTPDLLALTPKGRIYWIEVKTKEGTLSHTQAAFHRELMKRRQNVIIVTDVKEVQSIWGNHI